MPEEFSQQDSLQLIESMINKAKNKFSENGTLYLVWGFTILACCLAQFVLQHFYQSTYADNVWLLIWPVLIYQVFFIARKRKKNTVKTYTGEMMGYIWLAFGVCMFLFCFIQQYEKAYSTINPGILMLYGIPTFLSGIIFKFRPLIIGGIICWLLCIPCLFVTYQYQFVFLAAAVIAAWIIPGYLLRTRYKKQN